MPRLVIDNLEIEVPAGTKVIEAAERLGIMIPRFCYHHALGAVGACRMCAVKFLQGPFKGVQMSCMVDALDGMVVSTTDEEATAFRKQVIEWLMLNHPHDCPVCDEGGQCLLQDETVSGGHGIRRALGPKRTYRDQYLGVFISHEMNRCIHCYRCVRYYQEFTGYRDLGAMQIGDRVYFGRFRDGPLESPFAGNLVDLCPTGVYTDKPSRYRVRRWDLQRSPSLCIHCSLGCNTIANARYREMMRIEARFNEVVNGHFICDRGRYGFQYANHPERPRKAKINGAEVPMPEAVRAASEGLAGITRDFGSGAVAVLGSTRNSIETQAAIERISKMNDWHAPNYFVNPILEAKVKRAVSRLDEPLAVSMRGIENADFILAIGVDPVNEAPMLALAMRQAHRKEAEVVVVDPRPIFLPFPCEHIPMLPGEFAPFLDALALAVSGAVPGGAAGSESTRDEKEAGGSPGFRDRIASVARKIGKSRNPVIVCGSDICPEETPDASAGLATVLHGRKDRAGLFYVLPGPNAFASVLWDRSSEWSFLDTVSGMEEGAVRALLVVEADPLRDFPDHRRLEAALGKLDLLIVLDYLPSETVKRAHIFIPSTALFESGSSFVNQEGRLQYAEPVHGGGVPILQVSGGSHPPRVFDSAVPGGDPEPSRQILQAIAGGEAVPEGRGLADNPLRGIADLSAAFEKLRDTGYPAGNIRVLSSGPPVRIVYRGGEAAGDPQSGNALELILADCIFGSEELSAYSGILSRVEPEPHAVMHAEDAAGAGLSAGDTIRISFEGGSIEIRLEVSTKMARGALILPRRERVARQVMKGFSAKVPLDRIERI